VALVRLAWPVMRAPVNRGVLLRGSRLPRGDEGTGLAHNERLDVLAREPAWSLAKVSAPTDVDDPFTSSPAPPQPCFLRVVPLLLGGTSEVPRRKTSGSATTSTESRLLMTATADGNARVRRDIGRSAGVRAPICPNGYGRSTEDRPSLRIKRLQVRIVPSARLVETGQRVRPRPVPARGEDGLRWSWSVRRRPGCRGLSRDPRGSRGR
jgi:hypothetical protein